MDSTLFITHTMTGMWNSSLDNEKKQIKDARFQGSAVMQFRPLLFCDVMQCRLAALPLQMRLIGCHKMSITSHPSTPRNIPEQ